MAAVARSDEYLEEGLHLYGLGELDRALHLWRTALKADPRNERLAQIIAYAEALQRGDEPPQAAPPIQAVAVREPAGGGPARPRRTTRDRKQIDHLLTVMATLERSGDQDGALRIADQILRLDPEHPRALDQRQRARQALVDDVIRRLEPLERVPRRNRSLESGSGALPAMEGNEAAVLARIDGYTTLRDLLVSCGLPRLEAARAMRRLLDAGAVIL